jgi:putative lipoprotein (rSAM/lipoprotein system)
MIRIKLLQGGNRIIAFFLALLGFACTPQNSPIGDLRVAYGTPSADYIIKGVITSATDNSPVKEIRITALFSKDTIKSDQKGAYLYKASGLSIGEIPLSFRDTDGATNGSFEAKDTIVTFINPVFTGDDGHWYRGKTEKVVNIKLKLKP